MDLTKRHKKSVFESVKVFLNSFFNTGTIHGINYLALELLHYMERLFWILLIGASFYFCTILSLESWERYQTKSTVVTIENDHYYWNSTLPSLTVCPMDRINRQLFDKYCQTLNVEGEEKTKLFHFLTSLANSTYINFENIKSYPGLDDLNIRPEDYMEIIFNMTEDLTMIGGEEPIVNTKTNSEFILTVLTVTEFGLCYTTNNHISQFLVPKTILFNQPFEYEEADKFHFKSKLHKVCEANLFDEQVTYSFIGFANETATFIHSAHEVLNPSKTFVYANDAFEFQAYTIEILATDEFREKTTIQQRGCRFYSESNLTHFHVYTKGLCMQECRIHLAIKHCGCIPHFYPNKIENPKPVCSYKTLQKCFPPKKDIFLQFRENGRSVECSCEPNCSDSIIIIEKTHILPGTKDLLGAGGSLVAVQKYSTIRFVRRVLFTFTDLLVSIGGTAGLLLGFSVLGLVEIIYFFTLRLFWYIKGRK